jgi:S-adenosylmethionine:tRNA ribosyltransferase-isomerase
MKTSHFSFNLPEELIAQHPSGKRGESRLMVLDRKSGDIQHLNINDLPDIIPQDGLMVFNNSRVRKARLFGISEGGNRVEFLLLKPVGDGGIPAGSILLSGSRNWLAMVSKSKRQKPGKKYSFPGGVKGEIISAAEDGSRLVRFSDFINDSWLDEHGRIPLPPYIKREDQLSDAERYQTVYSEKTGSIAAPTAGLHFNDKIISRIKDKGIKTAFISLHVGQGTFLPVRTKNILDHKMHSETYEIDDSNSDIINQALKERRPLCAVGTTSVRTLESEAKLNGDRFVKKGTKETDIFIYPGFRFRMADLMLTNFHTPESSLLMLVSAFAGKELIDTAYAIAVENKYRFFSYGDAMLIK